MKALIRGIIDILEFLILSPFVLLFGVIVAMCAAWQRFTLWLYYDGDTNARDKDEWKRR